MILEILDLSIRYSSPDRPVHAVNKVQLNIPKGGSLGIVGESGSGKSTVALAIMGLLGKEAEVLEGEIRFDGLNLLKLPLHQWRRLCGRKMALVFQDPFTAMNPSLRICDQVSEALSFHRGMTRKQARIRAIELLTEVGIANPDSVAEAYPHQLSGGMLQRALIASALAPEPELLILDEPTTALDVTIEAQILDLLVDLKRSRQLSLLFISHNLAVVRRTCDDLAVMYAGSILETGSAEEVFNSPLHPYTKGLLSSMPALSNQRRSIVPIPGRLPSLVKLPKGCIFEPRCHFADSYCGSKAQSIDKIGKHGVRCHRARILKNKPWLASASDIERSRKYFKESPLIKVQALTKTFRMKRSLATMISQGFQQWNKSLGVRAIIDVSLDIMPGETVGLVGESGSGKSTLGRTILRLTEPDSGTIHINGNRIEQASPRALSSLRKDAQIIFQNPDSSLNPHKTVRETITRPLIKFGIVPPGEVKKRVDHLLSLVRLSEAYAERFPYELSGGEKQRIGIARAIATEPRFIICDEPLSALDVSVQAAILNLLIDLRDRLNMAYLFISHDISVVAHIADRVAVMYRGHLVEVGPVEHVLFSPAHPYTEALLSAVPQIETPDKKRIKLLGEPSGPVLEVGCVFQSRCHRSLGKRCETVTPPLRRYGLQHTALCHLEEIPPMFVSKGMTGN